SANRKTDANTVSNREWVWRSDVMTAVTDPNGGGSICDQDPLGISTPVSEAFALGASGDNTGGTAIAKLDTQMKHIEKKNEFAASTLQDLPEQAKDTSKIPVHFEITERRRRPALFVDAVSPSPFRLNMSEVDALQSASALDLLPTSGAPSPRL